MTLDPTSEAIRGRNSRIRYFTHFESRTSISTINQRLFEATEAMKAVEATEAAEAMEAVEVMDAIEATEVVKMTVTEAVWAMEARL